MAANTDNESTILFKFDNGLTIATRDIPVISSDIADNTFSDITNSDITNVVVLSPYKVVETTFGDGKKIKTVCQDGDEFSLSSALYIAIAKHEFGSVYTNAGIEKFAKENLPYMKKYEKIVRHGLSLYKADEKRKQDNIRKKISEADIRQNREKKRKEKFARKKQQQIDMLAEAIVKANNSAVAKRHKHE